MKFAIERQSKERDEKIKQLRLKVADIGSYALVVQKNEVAVKNYVQEKMSISKGRARSTKKNEAYFKGINDGQKISINKGIEG